MSLLEFSPDAVILIDRDGYILEANERVMALFGHDPTELVGEPIEILVPSALRDDHVGMRDEYLSEPTTRPMGAGLELRAERRDGTTVPVDIALSPVEEPVGAVMAVVRDISDRVRLRRRYRSILEAIPDPVVVADPETGAITDANDEAGDLLGYDRETLQSMTVADLHPSAEEARYRRLFDAHVENGRGIFTEHPDGGDIELETATGETFPVEINARVFGEGEDRRIVGVFRDISARRHHERALRALHEATRELMDARTPEAVGEIAVAAAREILGHELNAIHLFDDSAGGLAPVAATDRASTLLETLPTFEPDGSLAWRAYERGEPAIHDDVREASAVMDPETPIRSEMCLPLGDHGVFIASATTVGAFDERDVTLARILASNIESALDQVEREVALQDREAQLRRESERLAEFAHVVSHDIRSPLSVATGHLELVRDEIDDEHLDSAMAALDRVGELVDDTLALARAGDLADEETTVDLSSLVTESWAMTDTGAATLRVADGVSLRAHPSSLKRLVENLFRNAIQHGGETVTVRVGSDEPGSFYVADDGPGIPAADRADVFEPGHTTSAAGTGMGLAIVRRIARAHGWTVSVEEHDDGGAKFVFAGVETFEVP